MSTDIHEQLTDIAIDITGRVAELLAVAIKDLDPQARGPIEQMIEENLPVVVTNMIFKTTVLHSAEGANHLKSNVDHYAHQIAQTLITRPQ
jgi:hypothetical protein